jgi:hypothetical protein
MQRNQTSSFDPNKSADSTNGFQIARPRCVSLEFLSTTNHNRPHHIKPQQTTTDHSRPEQTTPHHSTADNTTADHITTKHRKPQQTTTDHSKEPRKEAIRVLVIPVSCFGDTNFVFRWNRFRVSGDTDFVFRTTPVSCFGDTGFVFW